MHRAEVVMTFERLSLPLLLVGGLVSCSESITTSPVPDMAPVFPDTGPDRADFGVFDQGIPDPVDMGEPEDMGPPRFNDPAALFEGQRSIANARMRIQVRGSETSTLTPILMLSHGPSVGFEYLVEPTDFLLGPGGVEDPNRLVFFIDLPGAGRSDEGSLSRPDVTIENQYAFLIIAIEEYFHTFDDRPYDVIGHHFGGLIATLLANRRPDLVEDVVLISPYPLTFAERGIYNSAYRTSERISASDRQFINDLQGVPRCFFDPNQCALEIYLIFARTWVCRENDPAFQTLDIRFVSAGGISGFGPTNLYPGSIVEDWEANPFDLASETAGVQARTTMITGACDLIPETTYDMYAQIPGLTRIEFDESGHFPMVEQPELFEQAIFQALDSEDF